MISTVQFLTSTWEIIFIGNYPTFATTSSNDPEYSESYIMSSAIASLVKGAAQTAHTHVAALLAQAQVKPGDKLPLKETVKEADATKPITLAPSGKNIFVRTTCALAVSVHIPPPSFFACLLLFLKILSVIMRKLTIFFALSLFLPIIYRNRLACLEPSRPRVIRRYQDTLKSTTSLRRRALTRSTSSA